MAETDAAQRLERSGVASDALRAEALRLLGGAEGFVPASDRRARHLLGQIIIQRAEAFGAGPGGSAVAHVVLTVELAPVEGTGGSMRETGRAAEPLGPEADALRGGLDRAARAALARAVSAFSLEIQAERKRDAELVKDLSSPEPRVRDQAVRALADRGAHDAVPELVKHLKDPDPEVVERTVGALAQLHDPRAVPGLIELTRHRDGPYVANVVRIVGDLGGPEARAWLLTLSSGHPDDVVRGAAGEALAELRAREPSPQAAAAKRTP